MAWYKKYLAALGASDKLQDEVYQQICNNLQKLERGPIDVSFVFIAYNEEDRLLPSVWSVSEMKTKLSVEVIVVNNASTDRTQEIIDRMGVRSVYQPKPGHGHARQAGLDIARGKYHFTADADTLYPSTYIDAMMKRLATPGVSAVFTSYGFYADGPDSQWMLSIYEFFRDRVFWLRSRKRPEYCVGGATMAFYAEQARQIGWRTHIKRGEDGAMLTELKKFGRPVLILNKETRVRGSSRRLYKDGDGSLVKMVWRHLYKDIKRLPNFFRKQSHYEDRPFNLR